MGISVSGRRFETEMPNLALQPTFATVKKRPAGASMAKAAAPPPEAYPAGYSAGSPSPAELEAGFSSDVEVADAQPSGAHGQQAPEPESPEPEAQEPEASEPEAPEPEATQPEATEQEAPEPEAAKIFYNLMKYTKQNSVGIRRRGGKQIFAIGGKKCTSSFATLVSTAQSIIKRLEAGQVTEEAAKEEAKQCAKGA